MVWVRLFSYDPVTVFMGLFVLVYAVFLLILHRCLHLKGVRGKVLVSQSAEQNGTKPVFAHIRGRNLKPAVQRRLRLWQFLCLIPLVMSIIHFAFFRIRNIWYYTERLFGGFYLASIFIAFWPIFAGRKRGWNIASSIISVLVVACTLHTFVYPASSLSAVRNHSFDTYTDAFVRTTEDMEQYYSLQEHKKTDIPFLRDEILPLIQKAEEADDPGLYYAAMLYYAYRFYDGHVAAYADDDDAYFRALQLLSGYDYGMSMVQLDDGRIIAVAVGGDREGNPASAYQNGIRNGMEIVSWNGLPVEEVLSQVEVVYQNLNWPVAENEKILKPVLLGTKPLPRDGSKGIGSTVDQLLWRAEDCTFDDWIALTYAETDEDFETACNEISSFPDALVGYRDADGTVKEVRLSASEYAIDRFETVYLNLYNLFWETVLPENFGTCMLTEETGMLRLWREHTNTFQDIYGYLSGKDPWVHRMFIEKLDALKEQGMTKLIIDARYNRGGFPAIDRALASLFTDETFAVDIEADCIDGGYRELKTNYVEGNGRYMDVDVVLLVDSLCVSAGDYLVKVMGACPNVTVMGLTTSNCSCQAQGGLSVLSGVCEMSYPVNWMFDQEGRRFIDTDESRTCTLPLDVKIPLTEDAVREMLYEDGSDYQLQYALNYLEPDAGKADFASMRELWSDTVEIMQHIRGEW